MCHESLGDWDEPVEAEKMKANNDEMIGAVSPNSILG